MDPGASGRTDGGRILLVDDETSIRDLVRRLLEAAGYEVVEAADAEEALRLFGSAPEAPRLVLTDLSLPDLDGWELCRRVRSMHPSVPILVMSGSFELNTLLAADAPDVGFLQKPFAPEELYRRVNHLLRRPPGSSESR